MTYKVHYAPLELNGQDIKCFTFETLVETSAFILTETEIDTEVVFLICIDEILFVSEYISQIVKFTQDWVKELTPAVKKLDIWEIDELNNMEINIFLQEYSSYEEAYKVALDMKETSPLCYE